MSKRWKEVAKKDEEMKERWRKIEGKREEQIKR